jgi:hypothetical protein
MIYTCPMRDDMSRRFWISFGLTLPLILVTMGDYMPAINLHRWFGVNSLRWVQAALGTPCQRRTETAHLWRLKIAH